MYNIDWNIEFRNPNTGKKFRLQLLYSVEIDLSVENLCDTARISLPESVMNRVMEIESKISRGTEVTIQLGYNGDLKTEFVGFIREIKNIDSTLVIDCEDKIFLFRKPVKNEVLKPSSVAQVVRSVVAQVAPEVTVVCDYDLGYEKFVINQANAFDVLKKIQEETKANIYMDSVRNELHVHAPFVQKSGEVKYNPYINVQASSLEYKSALDRKFEITVESIGTDGQIKSVKRGTTGGETVTIKVSSMSDADMMKVGDAELSKRASDRYEGSIDTWLIPRVVPTSTAIYDDPDYPEKRGGYYVPAVKVKVDEAGATRTVNFGIRLS